MVALTIGLLAAAAPQSGIARAQTPTCQSDPYAAAQATDADTVYYWNGVLLDAFRGLDAGPTVLARIAGMMHTGIYDVLNSVFWSHSNGEGCGWDEYLVLGQAATGTDADLAAGYAARDILLAELPEAHHTEVEQAFNSRHGQDFQQEAFQLGSYVAQAMITARSNDGSDDNTPYTADTPHGAWEPTGSTAQVPCATTVHAVTPNWGNVTPFTMTSGSQFRQPLPGGFSNYADLLASSFYATAFNDVKRVGSKYASSSARTADQTQSALFWANDLSQTYRPPGQLLEHTEIVARQQPDAVPTGAPDDFEDDWSEQGIRVARLFAQVSLGLADAGIAARDSKYLTSIDLWRPDTAIRDAEFDNNAATYQYDGWQPLSRDANGASFSPCFPSWISGHGTFAAAWARVMQHHFGDNVTYTGSTDDPNAVGVQRTFSSFTQAAEENARSRVFLGVHFQFDADDALDTGYALADQLATNFLTFASDCPDSGPCTDPIPSPSTRLAAGDRHNLAVELDGTVSAWGRNNVGQLGDGTTTNRSVPVQVTGLSGVAAVAAGDGHSLALKTDGTVLAWGANGSSELGDGTTINRSTPVQVAGLDDVIAVAAGAQHSLAVKGDGTVWAWGNNSHGQVGDGTTTVRRVPVQAATLDDVIGVSAGSYHSLAVKANGTSWAWGLNGNGRLGDGTTISRSTAVQVSGPADVTTVAAYGPHSMAIDASGIAWGWGFNRYGAVGDGTTTDRMVPVPVAGLSDVIAISGGHNYSLAVTSDGTPWAWGWNGDGELGDGTTTNRSVPVEVASLSSAVAMTGGGAHTVAFDSGRHRWAWGLNDYGQLGDGSSTGRLLPGPVAGS